MKKTGRPKGSKGKNNIPAAVRFLDKIEMVPESTCHYWTGHVGRWGYGTIGVDGKSILAHRFSYELYIGPIPEGLLVCHHCDQPLCQNPRHLFLGTNFDNMADKTRKGRHHSQRKTHCPKGHEYSPENTRMTTGKDGKKHRECISCARSKCAQWQKDNRTHYLALRRKWRLKQKAKL